MTKRKRNRKKLLKRHHNRKTEIYTEDEVITGRSTNTIFFYFKV